jgi:hypothetical protein
MIRPLIPAKSDSRTKVPIRWTTRPRCAENTPKVPNTDSYVPPDSHTQRRQDSPLHQIRVETNAWSNEDAHYEGANGAGADDGSDADTCAVCLSRAPDCELRPCGHARCCRQCVVETVCTWRQSGAPRCAFCRAPFHAMVFFE